MTYSYSFICSNKSCDNQRFVDITGSFLHSSEDEDQDGEMQKTTEGPDSPSFQVLDGSVLVTPSKAFQSDTSEGQTSDSSLSGEEPDDSDNETKYGCHLYVTFCI